MKILMITDTYPPNVNGAALATERLTQELAKRGHNVYVIAPSTSFKFHITRQKNVTIFRVRSLPILVEKTQEFRVSPKPFHDKDIRRIVREIKPDIVHINEPWLMGLSGVKIARTEGIPIVATHHFMPENLVHYLHMPLKVEEIITRTIWKWYCGLCEKFDVVICPTQTAADLIQRYTNKITLRVISNGIDLSLFNKNNDGSYLRQKLRLPEKQVLLFVGRLDKEKNIDVLIRACALIKEKANYHLVIVGQGKERNSLKKLAVSLGIQENITFTGLIPKKDLPNMYAVADIFVMPSIAELQSLVTMEAMATGLPVVGAKAVALPHLIHDKQNGFLFQPGDDKDLADKLLQLLTDKKLAQEMGRKSLKLIQEHDISKTIVQVENTYKEAIEQYASRVKTL